MEHTVATGAGAGAVRPQTLQPAQRFLELRSERKINKYGSISQCHPEAQRTQILAKDFIFS